MISEEQLNEYRIEGTRIRVVRDAEPSNDIKGIVVAWDDTHVIIRKQNRRVVKLPRTYIIQPFNEERINPFA